MTKKITLIMTILLIAGCASHRAPVPREDKRLRDENIDLRWQKIKLLMALAEMKRERELEAEREAKRKRDRASRERKSASTSVKPSPKKRQASHQIRSVLVPERNLGRPIENDNSILFQERNQIRDTEESPEYYHSGDQDEESQERSNTEDDYATVESGPRPPHALYIWIVVHRGKVFKHRMEPIAYPGDVRKIGHQKTKSGIVVTFASTYDPDVRWRALLPRHDGKYKIQARLER
jgi:hypothetical protein